MISEKMQRKRNEEGIFGNYQINYSTEFDLYNYCIYSMQKFWKFIFKVDVKV